MRHLKVNSCWVFPIIFLFPTISFILMRGIVDSDEQLKLLGNFHNCIIMVFRQIAEFAFTSVIHFWVSILLVERFKLPPIVSNLPFFTFYLVVSILNILDFEMGKNSMQFESPSWLLIYLLRLGKKIDHFSKPLYSMPPPEYEGNDKSGIITEMMRSNPIFFLFKFGIIFGIIIGSLIFLFLYRYDVVNSTLMYKYYKKNFPENAKTPTSTGPMIQKKKISVSTFFTLLNHILGLVYFLLCIQKYFSNSIFKLSWFSYFTFLESTILSLSDYEKSIDPKLLKKMTKISRSYLPPGRRWLDQRKDPIFPAVHADLETFCAYNNNHKDCRHFEKNKKAPLVDEIPNVLFIIYESLTPGTDLISEEFLKEQTHIPPNDPRKFFTDTKYYNPKVMKNFSSLQEYGITFSGLSSLGVPTSSGWHSLMTGMTPSQSFMNILDARMIHSDDFPSQMRDSGFRTMHMSASFLNWDCSNLLVWRRSAEEEAATRLKCKEAFGDLNDDELHKTLLGKNFPKLNECHPQKIKNYAKELKKKKIDYPKTYDYVDAYFPRNENLQHYMLEDKRLREKTLYVCDRVLSSSFLTHWKQQRDLLKRKNIKKPLFGTILSIESHIEFFGYDLEEFYEDKLTEEDKKNVTEYTRKRFVRVNRYADKYYIGTIIDWFKKNEPNTIFVITGDHGSRKMPTYGPDETIVDDVVFSSDCVHKSSGIDSFFVTSGMIGYLGDDPKVKEVLNLERLKGKTVKIPTDHNDLVYTVEEIINKLNGTSMQPTHRRSRNLIDLATGLSKSIEEGTQNEYLETINQSKWKSVSQITYFAEYREGISLLRTHPGDPKGAHFYQRASYPNCVRQRAEKPHEVGTRKGMKAYKKMFKYLNVENYLVYHNRLYNYAFRDKECVKKGHCEFPKVEPAFGSYSYIYVLFIFGIYLCINVAIFLLIEFASFIYFIRKKSEYFKFETVGCESATCRGDKKPSNSENVSTKVSIQCN